MGEVSNSPEKLPVLTIQDNELKSAGNTLVQLLQCVDACGWNLYKGPAIQRAVWRYETIWLPLVAATSLLQSTHFVEEVRRWGVAGCIYAKEIRAIVDRLAEKELTLDLVPPVDVAWVWYLHRLSGKQYLFDLARLVGVQIAPNASTALRYGTSKTCPTAEVWNSVETQSETGQLAAHYFPSYLNPMIDDQAKPVRRRGGVGSLKSVPFSPRCTYNIGEAAQKHRGVLTYYLNCAQQIPNFLSTSIDRYKKFLQLHVLAKCTRMVFPPEDVDFVWRSHIAATADYVQDDLVFAAFDGMHGLEADSSCENANNIGRPPINAYTDALVLQSSNPAATSSDSLFLSEQEATKLWETYYEKDTEPYILHLGVRRATPKGQRDGYLQNKIHMSLALNPQSEDQDWDIESNCDSPVSATTPNSFSASFRRLFSKGYQIDGHKTSGSTLHGRAAMCRDECSQNTPDTHFAIDDKWAERLDNHKRKVMNNDSISVITTRRFPYQPLVVLSTTGRQSHSVGKYERKGGKAGKSPRSAHQRKIDDDKRYQREKYYSTRNHTMGKNSDSKDFRTRSALIGASLAICGVVWIVAGIAIMHLSSKPLGICFVCIGLFFLLISAAAFSRPDAVTRAKNRDEKKARREDRKADKKERKESKKELKNKAQTNVHVHSFGPNETSIYIGTSNGVEEVTMKLGEDVESHP